MRERGIIFDAESVRAILAGAKSQTRRVIKPQPHGGLRNSVFVPSGIEDGHGREIKPRYQPGDRLYVKEAWQTDISLDPYTPAKIAKMCLDAGYEAPWSPVQYADDKRINWWEDAMPGRIRSPLHMPRWAVRIWLEVLAVRAEQLQSIKWSDIKAEGILELDEYHKWVEGASVVGLGTGHIPRMMFERRWDTLNRRRGFPFESNCFVFVYEFRKLNHGP